MTQRIILLLLTSLTAILTACGGGDDTKDKEVDINQIEFPQSLPAVNPALATDTPNGIWMVVSDSEFKQGEKDFRTTYRTDKRQFIVIEHTPEDYFIRMQMCNLEWYNEPHENIRRKDFDLSQRRQTIKWFTQDNILTTTYDFYFSQDFNRFYGELSYWNKAYYGQFSAVNPDKEEHFFAVKISDSTELHTAPELSLVVNSDTPGGQEDSWVFPHCINLENSTLTIDDDSDSSFSWHETKSIYFTSSPFNALITEEADINDDNGKLHAGHLNYGNSGLMTYGNFECYASDDCSDQLTINTSIYQNDKNGIIYAVDITIPDYHEKGSDLILQPQIALTLKDPQQ